MATLISTNVTGTLDILNSSSNIKLLRLSHPTSPTTAGGFLGFNSDGTTNDMVVTLGVQYSTNYYNVINIKRDTRNVGIGTPSPANDLTVAGDIGYTGYLGQGSIYGNAANASYARVQLYDPTTGYTTFNNISYGYYFQTANSTKVTILNNGNVGIGTPSPDYLLHIYKSGADSVVYIKGASSGADARLHISGYQSSEIWLDRNGTGKWNLKRQSGTDDLYLYKQNNNFTDNSAIQYWDFASGNVGIGTTDPEGKLHVNGMIKAGIAGNSSANTPALLVSAAGVNPEQSAIAIQQNTNSGDTIIFADYEPYVEYGISTDNGSDTIEFTAGTSTNNLGSKTLYNQSGNARTAYKKLIFSLTSGNMSVGGNVGIGTTSPNYKLHVAGTAHTTGNFSVGNGGNGGGASISPGGGTAVYALTVDRSGSSGSSVDIWDSNSNSVVIGALNNERTLTVKVGGNVGINTPTPQGKLDINTEDTEPTHVYINGEVNQNKLLYFRHYANSEAAANNVALGYIGSNGIDNLLSLGHLNSSGTDVPIMHLTEAGNVGIGTASPEFKLQVENTVAAGSDNFILNVRNTTHASDSRAGIAFRMNNNTGSNWDGAGIQATNDGVTGAGHLTFGSVEDNTYTENVRINSSGNVGIGTTAPTGAKLQVAGGIRISNASKIYLYTSNDVNYLTYNRWQVHTSTALAIDNTSTGGFQVQDSGVPVLFVGTDSTYGGRVGIGTVTPGYPLHVVGKIYSSTEGQFGNTIVKNNSGVATFGSNSTATTIKINLDASASRNDLVIKGSTGNVGIGTANPLFKLHVNGDIYQDVGYSIYSNANRGWYRGNYTTTGSGVSNGKIVTLNPAHGQTASSNYHYIFELTTIGTSTDSGATYIGVYSANTSAWSLRAVSLSGGSSNHPQLSVSGNNFTVYTNHSSNYTVVVSVTSVYNGDADSTAHSLGANYQWQRAVNDLYYNDGFVGIGTGTPSQKLHVQGNLRVTGAYYASDNNAGSSNQVLTSTGSGGTDWKSISDISDTVTGSGTTNYVTKWSNGANSDLTNSLIYDNGTNVGISTATPSAKLHVHSTTGILHTGDNFYSWVLKYLSNQNSSSTTVNYYLIATKTQTNVRLDGVLKGARSTGVSANSGGGTRILFNTNNAALAIGGLESWGTDHPTYGHPIFTIVEVTYNSVAYYALRISPSSNWVASFNHVQFEGIANNVLFTNVGAGDVSNVLGFSGSESVFSYQHGNLGIGTGSPDALLHIDTGANSAANFRLGANRTSANAAVGQLLGDWNGTIVSKIAFKTGDDTTNKDNGEIAFEVAAAGSTAEAMRIDTSGNVGIGTTVPSDKLHVVQNTDLNTALFQNTSGRAQVIIDSQSTAHNSYLSLSNGGSEFAFLDAKKSINLLRIATTNTGAEIAIETNSQDEAVRIDSSGNVGIGTDDPQAQLHINGGDLDTRAYQQNNSTNSIYLNPTNGNAAGTSNTGGGGVIWKTWYNNYTKKSAGILAIGEGNYFRSGLAFYTNSNANQTTDWSERMRIKSDGKVGIGTTSPNQLLTVTGRSNFDSQNNYYGSWIDGDSSGDSWFAVGQWHNLGGRMEAGANNLNLYTHNTSHDLTLQKDGGNVGIGTGTPSTKLEVDGETKSTNYRFSGPSDGGAVPTYSNSSYATVKYNEAQRATELVSSSDDSIGMAFPAFRVNESAGEQWKLWVQYKASASSSTGFYARVYEYSANLPSNKIAVSHSASNPVVQEDTSGKTDWKNNVAISTTWVTSTYTYTPTAGAKWASIVLLNWGGMGYNSLYARVGKERFFGTSSVITGSGTSSKLPRWNGASSLTDSIITQSSTSYVTVFGGFQVSGNHTDTGTQLNLWCDSNGHGKLAVFDMQFLTGSNTARNKTALFLKTDGNVGVGTSITTATLHVKEIDTDEDAILKINPNNGSYDPVLQFTPQDGTLDNEGFEIWYDNNVGDAHLHTIYNNNAAAIRFHTRTGASKSTSNERLTIAGDGNVGIGTTSPNYKLHTVGGAGVFDVTGAATLNHHLAVTEVATLPDWRPYAGTTTAALQIQSSATRGILLAAKSTGNQDFYNTNGLDIYVASTIGTSSSDRGILAISAKSDGNVGIGTTNPSQALTVTGKIDTVTAMGTAGQWSSSQIRLETTNTVDTTGWQGISFDTSTTNNYGWSIGANRSGSGRGSFRVYEHIGTTAGTERFTIEQDGNVGVGTGSPDGNLEIWESVVNTAASLRLTGDPDAGANTEYANIIFHSRDSSTGANGGEAQIRAYRGGDRDAPYLNFDLANTGGTLQQVMTIHGQNNAVGIGTTNPGQKLHVFSGGTNNAARFESSDATARIVLEDNSGQVQVAATGDETVFSKGSGISETMRIDSSGNVGVGNTNPQGTLDLGNATGGKSIVWGGTSGTNHYTSIWSEYGSGSLVLAGGLKSSTTDANFIYPYTGTYGYAAIELDSFHDDGIKFYTAADAARTAGTVATKQERMRIDTSGNVGIGTTPNHKLEVTGDVAPDNLAHFYALGGTTTVKFGKYNNNDTYAGIIFETLNLAGTGAIASSIYQGGYTLGNTNLHISTSQDLVFYSNSAETVRMKNGNVGIGTADPKGKLHVSTTGNYTEAIISSVVNATSGSYLRLTEGANDWGSYGYLGGYIQYDGNDNLIIIGRHNTNGTTLTDDIPAITIKRDNGRVGIGTTNPSNPLHVVSGDNVLATFESTDANATLYLKDSNTSLSSTFKRITNDLAILESGGNVGINTTTPTSKLQIIGAASGDSVLKVDGTNGTLFEVVDDLSDSLMSVNDAAGLPVFEVFADNHIVAGRYNQNDFYLNTNGNVGIGTGSPSSRLHLVSNVALGNIFQIDNQAGNRALEVFQASTLNALYMYQNGALKCGLTASSSLGGGIFLFDTSGATYLTSYASVGTVFNESGSAVDFRIEGDTDANLFFVDGSTDRIGIGTNAPAQLLHVYGLTQLGAAGKTEGGAVLNYASFGETKSSASTILGNAIVPGTANSTVQRSKSDAGNFVRIKYNTGICFHTNVTSTINTNTAETTNERVRIDLTGNLLISDGLVGAPSLSFINDTDTGMWRPGANQLRLVTGGTNAIVINSSQAIQLPDYGSGNNTGTRAYFLAVDSAGNIIEDSGGGGGTIGDGTITLAAGTGLTGGGSFTTNQTANATITFNATGGGGGGGTVTSVTVGAGLDVTNGTTTPAITLDLKELPDMTEAWVTADDYFIVLDNNSTQKKKVSSAIFGTNAFNSTSFITASSTSTLTNKSGSNSQWTNDENYSTTTGTVTGTGTDGYISKWSAASEIQNSNVFQGANGNVGIGTTTNINTKLLVEGDATVNGDLSAGGSAAANRTLTLNSVAQAGRPAAKINNPNLDTATASNGRTFHGWLPIDLDGTVKYIPVYN